MSCHASDLAKKATWKGGVATHKPRLRIFTESANNRSIVHIKTRQDTRMSSKLYLVEAAMRSIYSCTQIQAGGGVPGALWWCHPVSWMPTCTAKLHRSPKIGQTKWLGEFCNRSYEKNIIYIYIYFFDGLGILLRMSQRKNIRLLVTMEMTLWPHQMSSCICPWQKLKKQPILM